jgi:hypothetical protein
MSVALASIRSGAASRRGARGIEAMECNYHHLVTTDPHDVVKYSTRSDALAALHKLLAKRAAEGFTVEFWIDDANGDIVGSCSSGKVPQGLEIDSPVPSSAPNSRGS